MNNNTYLITETKFSEWLSRDMADAFVPSIVLEKNSDGMFLQGMTRTHCAGTTKVTSLHGCPRPRCQPYKQRGRHDHYY